MDYNLTGVCKSARGSNELGGKVGVDIKRGESFGLLRVTA